MIALRLTFALLSDVLRLASEACNAVAWGLR